MGSFTITVTDQAFLALINDCVHDEIFKFADVTHNAEHRAVIVPFRLDARQIPGVKLKWRQKLFLPARLQINEVTHVELEDSYGVGTNTLNVVKFDPIDRRVVVVTDVPTTIALSVRELHVSVTADSEHGLLKRA